MIATERLTASTARRVYGEESVGYLSDCEGEMLDASSWSDEQIDWYLGKRGLRWNAKDCAWLDD